MSTLAVANQKGGVGKTTTTISLGAALSALEKRVLIVDCDPQGNATRGLGAEAGDRHLYHALIGECSFRDIVRGTGFPHLSLAASDRDLVGVEVEMVGTDRWQYRLDGVLEEIRGEYDVVLLDCPPSLGHLTVNALVAADGVLVPLQCEYFALEGISELVATVDRVQQALNAKLSIAGVILTMYDERTNLARDVADEVRSHFGERAWKTVIPRNVRLAEAPSHGVPIFEYDIKCRGAQAYLDLAKEFIRRAA